MQRLSPLRKKTCPVKASPRCTAKTEFSVNFCQVRNIRFLTVARYDGGRRIVSRLENGTVEVVNLMARRTAAIIDLRALRQSETARLPPGHHLLYAFGDAIEFDLDGVPFVLSSGHAATVDGTMMLTCRKGTLLVATVGALAATMLGTRA